MVAGALSNGCPARGGTLSKNRRVWIRVCGWDVKWGVRGWGKVWIMIKMIGRIGVKADGKTELTEFM
jgi:hypothetical protein